MADAAAPAAPQEEKAAAKPKPEPVELKPATASREDNLQYDMKHMAAYDISPLSTKVDFMSYTRDSVQLLMNKIFALNRVKLEEGQAVELPREELFRLPRTKPVPKEKPKTRFQKFMEEKNMTKRKRSRLVFDDESGDWKPRWGYGSIKKSQEASQWAYEVKAGEDPMSNPFEKRAVEQKLAAARHKMREVRNKVEAAGGKLRASVPDLSNLKTANTNRGKDGLKEAMRRAQTSSASRGKFDRTAPNEATNLQPKKKKMGFTRSMGEEKEAYMKTATRLLEGKLDNDKAAKAGKGQATQVPRGQKGKKSARRSKNGGKQRSKR